MTTVHIKIVTTLFIKKETKSNLSIPFYEPCQKQFSAFIAKRVYYKMTAIQLIKFLSS